MASGINDDSHTPCNGGTADSSDVGGGVLGFLSNSDRARFPGDSFVANVDVESAGGKVDASRIT